MSSLYDQAERGLRARKLKPALEQTVLGHLREWLEGEAFAAYRPQLEALIRRESWPLLVDSFYRVLPFGTGGRRGPVGLGPNRFNPYTLASSVQGHAEYLKLQQREQGWKALAVVIACDVRQFHDARGLYVPEVPDPCRGLSSRAFARIAAGVYAANGIFVWMLPDEDPEVLSTPELSFCIRRLGVQGGLNVSASHNPPDDNGAKVFNYTGGQEIPPQDEQMVQLVEQVARVRQLDSEAARAGGWIRWIPPEVRRAYLETVCAVSLRPDCREARVVYSPLHGAGKYSLGRALEQAGFPVIRVDAQWPDDSRFSAAPNGVPNPEEPSALALAIRQAQETGADLALATDPDADRLGAAAPDDRGRWRFLNGNEISVLLADYILSTRQELGTLPKHPLMIKTEVTTSLLGRLAEAYGVHLVGNLLVGFKYIAEGLRQIEETGTYGGACHTLEDFLLGAEESHGYLVTPAIRDKDAAGAGLLLAERAAACKREGRTLIGALEALYERFGLVRNALVPTVMTGAEGSRRIRDIQESVRKAPPQALQGQRVVRVEDLQDPRGRLGPILSETDRSSRDVLILGLEGGGRVILRPSGTEPKNKIYLEVPGTPQAGETLEALEARVEIQVRQLAEEVTREMLGRVGIELSTPALRVSGLVSLENKQDFEGFLGEFEQQAEACLAGRLPEAALAAWLRQRLKGYGLEPLGLVAEGVRAHVAAERTRADARRTQALNLLEQMVAS